MKTKYIASMLTLLLLASIFAFAFTIHRASADGTTLSISPSSVAKTPSDVGSTFTVQVQINSVSDLFGFDINVTWDNTLITFSSLSDTPLNTIWGTGNYFEPLSPNPQTGAGYVRFAAVKTGKPGFTGSGALYTLTFTVVKAGNFQYSTPIQFGTVKLSDSNANSIPVTLANGQYSMSATVPDIDFNLVNPNPAKPYEYGKYVEVQVYASNITSTLTGFDLTVDYNSEFLTFVKVQPQGGVLGMPSVSAGTAGIVEVSLSSSSTPYVGSSGLLFTLLFRVTFDQRSTHIWTTATSPNQFSATISLDTSTGSLIFTEGTIPIGQVTTPTPLTLTINLIQGDVDCNGQVNIFDLSTVAHFYDMTSTSSQWSTASKYDLKTDGDIDIYDLVLIAANFGYSIQDNPPAS